MLFNFLFFTILRLELKEKEIEALKSEEKELQNEVKNASKKIHSLQEELDEKYLQINE